MSRLPEPRLIEVGEADTETWRAIAAAAGHATWFHTFEWADLWCLPGVTTRPRGLLFRFDDGAEALVPATCHASKGGLVRAYTSSATGKYGGWIARTEIGAAHVRAIAAHLATLDLTLRQNPFAPHGDLMEWTREDFTQALDVTRGYDAILAGWSGNHRSSLARARKKGVAVASARSVGAWREYDAIYRDSLRRWGSKAQSVVPWDVFERLAATPSDAVRLWLARHEGRAVAGAVCFSHGTHTVYWHGAALESAFDVRPVHALFDAILEDAASRGLHWFDFNPSGGLPGVVRFKDGFGCVRLPANVYEASRRMTRVLRRVGRAVRRAG